MVTKLNFIGFTLSALAVILISTNGGIFQNAFGSSINDSVDDIVEDAEDVREQVRDNAEDNEEAREDNDEEARDRGDEEDEDEDEDDSDSDNDGGLGGDPEFVERVLGDNIDDERSNLVSEIEDNVREIKEKIREGTNPSGNNPSIAELFEMQMLMNHLSQISDMSTNVVSGSNQAIADLVRGFKG
jgi:Family of unknown function (DUF5407)